MSVGVNLNFDFTGKRVLVTGASRGSVNDAASKLSQELSTRVSHLHCDITDSGQVQQAMA